MALPRLPRRLTQSNSLEILSRNSAQEAYVRAVRQLAEHYHKSPDLISEEDLRQYFHFIKNVKDYSRNTSPSVASSSSLSRRSRKSRPPSTLCAGPGKEISVDEVPQILALVRLSRYKVCLTTNNSTSDPILKQPST
jgi:integrase/recombinase XerD